MSPVALITGGNRGIGFEVCRQLGQQGFHVLLGARCEQAGAEAARTLAAEGLSVTACTVDVTRAATISALADRIGDEFGRLDCLVNNSGVFVDCGERFLNVAETKVRETFEVNYWGAFRMIRAFARMLRESDNGRVVNVTSSHGSFQDMACGGGSGAYRTSKAALNALTVIMAAELAPSTLVNAVCPGWVRTEMGGQMAPRSPSQGAAGVIWAATLPSDGPTGGFFHDAEPIAW